MHLNKRYVLVGILFLFVTLAGASFFEDNDSSDFSQGNFYRTFYNSSGFVQLNISQGFKYGNFSSRIYDSGSNSTWQNISWFTELCYGCELPNGSTIEQGDFLRPANMVGNVLLAHFDELSGNATDYSGYNNPGIIKSSGVGAFEGPEYGASGKFNTSFDFETSIGSNGEFVNFSRAAQYNFTNQITIEAWVNPESFSNSPTIIDKDPSAFSLYFTSASTKLRADIGATQITGDRSFIANNWYHVVLTYNGSQVRLYSTGDLAGSPLAKTGLIAIGTRDLIVGSGWSGSNPLGFPFDGLIDEIAIYNRSLNAQEIKDHYLRGVLRLNLSVRSCDDSVCAGESFSHVNSSSTQTISEISNRYFQYKGEFTTENESDSPKLYNVTVGYVSANNPPSVNLTYPFNNTNYSTIQTHLNYTVTDTDLDSCWYTLDNGVINSSVSCGVNVTGLTSAQGTNNWRVYANDSTGTERNALVSFFVDSIAPLLSISMPTNNSVAPNTTIYVNYAVNDLGIGLNSCWWTNSSGVRNTTVGCGTNFSFVGVEGINLASIYANDTFGNTNNATITVNVNTQAPSVNILSPVSGSILGSTTNIELNYSAIDPTLQACWYTVTDGFLNLTLPNCLNSTLNVSSDGVYEIKIFANDTSGNIGFDSNIFTVSVDAPSINPISPVDKYFGIAASQNISFTYLPTDLDLQSCNLWTNSNGSYSLNQTRNSVASGQQNNFYLNLSSVSESSYLWAVQCNDSLGHSSISANSTFYIDRTIPAVTISAPTGTYTSLSNIPITLGYTDASPVKCTYNVTFAATGNLVIGNSELVNCADTTFTVDTESSYFFTLAVNDSAGNMNVTRKSFTVSVPTSSGGGSSSGSSSGGSSGGGGGSSASSIRPTFKLNIHELEPLIIGRGESESIELSIENVGLRFVNSCSLTIDGGISDWISGNEVKSLSPGQTTSYVFSVSVPIDVNTGDYFATIGVSCNETSSSISYNVKVSSEDFQLSILSSERQGTKLKVTYAIENFANKPQDFDITYKLLNDERETTVEGDLGKISLAAEERIEQTTEFELPKNAVGDYILSMELKQGIEKQNYEQQVRLTAGGISGFAISESNLKTISWFGIVVIFAFGIFLVVKMLKEEYIRRHGGLIPERQFISIDLNS
ncbi:MAG: LamG-like jellyroll fold domain-containing protein [Candidatus Pacearchaeota archaeon]